MRGPHDVPITAEVAARLHGQGRDESADAPCLQLHLHRPSEKDCPRGLIIVLPGGGYLFRSDREAANVCAWLNSLGLHAAVLHYRVQRRFPAAFLDARRAVQLVRKNAETWGVDAQQVGVLGFSAGGHVAAMLAAAWDTPPDLVPEIDLIDAAVHCDGAAAAKPACAILCYPVITASGDPAGRITADMAANPRARTKFGDRGPGQSRPLRHHGSCEVLLGREPLLCEAPEGGLGGRDRGWPQEELDRVSAEHWVRADALPPPIFLWHTLEDTTVPVGNSLRFASALAAVSAEHELHIFARGAHGLAMADGSDAQSVAGTASAWPVLCEAWLREQGWLAGA